MKISIVFATLLTTFSIFSSVSALNCFEWTEDDGPTTVNTVPCEPGPSENPNCVLIGLEGFSRITRQKLTLSQGMCDSGPCNATRLCNKALKNARNFDVTNCDAKCCDADMCNEMPFSTTPTEAKQTNPRVARSTKTAYRTIGVPMTTEDEVEDFDEIKPSAINCFSCHEGSKPDECHSLPYVSRCGLEYDSCVSITGTLADDEQTQVAYRNCGLAEINCNITQLCIDVRNKLFVNEGKEMASCNGYCCRNNFCNDFNPTRPVQLGRGLKTTKARRTATIKTRSFTSSKRSPPIKCYECKPEAFGAMCARNTTTRTCVTGYKGYDSCLTMTASITNETTNEVIDSGEWMDCAVRDMDCNANSSRCDTLSDILKSRGLGLKNCLVNCCKGDFCNSFVPTPGPSIKAQALSKAQGYIAGNISMLLGLFITNIFAWKLVS